MTIKEQLQTLPSCPGIYLMKDADGGIIYVGKSKNLKNRVTTYFKTPDPEDKKAMKLYHSIKSFDIITTDTELESLLLECQYIQQYKPWCNRLMKTPDSYVYIKLTVNKEYPDIAVCDEKKEDNALYFGPYNRRSSTGRAVDVIRAYYKMPCTSATKNGSTCLNYSLNKCHGTCMGKITPQEHDVFVQEIIGLLTGTSSTLPQLLEKKMLEASSSFDFEQAAKLRDKMNALSIVTRHAEFIQFTSSNPLFLVVEPMAEGCHKVLFLQEAEIIVEKLVESCDDIISLATDIYTNYRHLMVSSSILTLPEKHTMDSHYILYSYLSRHQNDCRYHGFTYDDSQTITLNTLSETLQHLFDSTKNKSLLL